MPDRVPFASVSMVVSLLALGPSPGALAQTRERPALITESVDEGRLVELEGHLRAEASPGNDRGPVSDAFALDHMLLQLRPSRARQEAARQLIDQLHDPRSPNYHRWLTAEQFGRRFGPADADLATITAWLRSHGLRVNVVYPAAMVIDFSGRADNVRDAFRVEIHHLEVDGVKHVANMTNPRIPAALAPAVVGIVSLHDFKPRSMHRMLPNYTLTLLGVPMQAVVPEDLATIYNLNPLFQEGISGQGQTIALVEDTDLFSASDWTTFRSTFGLSGYAGSLATVHPAPPSGPNNCPAPGVNGDDGEAALDVEWASAAAPSAAIQVASCAGTATTFGGLIAILNLVTQSSPPPPIMSVSYGECEVQNGTAANVVFDILYQVAVARGVSVFVAAGDSGAAGCDQNQPFATHGIGVSGFASTPNNVAVGGTDYLDTFLGSSSTYWNATNTPNFGSAKSYIPEIPWNDSCASQALAYAITRSPFPYGSSGFCNSALGELFFATTAAGGGGPSGCAAGTPTTSGVVGGTCQGFPKPSWQSGVVGIPSDGVRDLPDVSMFAANGAWAHYFVFCFSDPAGGLPCTGAPSGWSGAGGTSFGAPILAGIQALVNQKAAARQGNPNFVYYKLAASEYGATGNPACNSLSAPTLGAACTFYDVTVGDMDVNCRGGQNCYTPSGTNGVLSTSNGAYAKAYSAGLGWDFATGIGTVNAFNLVHNWSRAAGASRAPVPAPASP